MAEKIKDLTTDVISAIRSHHNRISEKSFTKELTHEKLQRITQIIGLADVYEAVTHPRSYRKGKLPHEGIKELVEIILRKTKSTLKPVYDRSGETFVTHRVGSVLSASQDLGFENAIDIGDGISRLIRWREREEKKDV